MSATRRVVHYTDTAGFGGAEQMLLAIVEGLDRRRWQSVLVYHPQPSVERLAIEAAQRGIATLPLARRADGRHHFPALVRHLRSCRADVFHAHLTWGLRCSHGLVAAALARVPHRVATQQLFVRERRLRRRWRQRVTSAFVHRYHVVSEAMGHQLALDLFDRRKVRVVHNGIDPGRFDRIDGSSVRAELTRGHDRPIALTLARLDYQKGLQHLVAAASRLPNVLFVLAGEGAERGRVEAEIRRLGAAGHFVMLGHRTDVPQLLAACDVFVLPSLFEGLPVSILEAMASRRPVVATAVEGSMEAVEHGRTGWLVPPADATALAQAIRRVLSDPERAARMGDNGRARVEERFSAAAMVSGVERLYEELLDGKRTVPASDVARDRARISTNPSA